MRFINIEAKKMDAHIKYLKETKSYNKNDKLVCHVSYEVLSKISERKRKHETHNQNA